MSLKPLTTLGVVGTAVWTLFVCCYLYFTNQFTTVFESAPNNFGDFWAGTFAPLALWWLVLGYFQQGIELRQNVEALEKQSFETANLVAQAQAQAQAIQANELHARRDTFFKLAELIVASLDAIAGDIVLSGMDREGKERWGEVRLSNRDTYFSLAIDVVVGKYDQHLANWANKKTERKQLKLIADYIEMYELLLTEAEACDNNFQIRGFFNKTRMGRLYFGFCIRTKRKFHIASGRDEMSIEDIVHV